MIASLPTALICWSAPSVMLCLLKHVVAHALFFMLAYPFFWLFFLLSTSALLLHGLIFCICHSIKKGECHFVDSRSWSHNRNCTDCDFPAENSLPPHTLIKKIFVFLFQMFLLVKTVLSFGFFSYSLYFWNMLVQISFWTLDALFFLSICTLQGIHSHAVL